MSNTKNVWDWKCPISGLLSLMVGILLEMLCAEIVASGPVEQLVSKKILLSQAERCAMFAAKHDLNGLDRRRKRESEENIFLEPRMYDPNSSISDIGWYLLGMAVVLTIAWVVMSTVICVDKVIIVGMLEKPPASDGPGERWKWEGGGGGGGAAAAAAGSKAAKGASKAGSKAGGSKSKAGGSKSKAGGSKSKAGGSKSKAGGSKSKASKSAASKSAASKSKASKSKAGKKKK